jgi:hypothetical protein
MSIAPFKKMRSCVGGLIVSCAVAASARAGIDPESNTDAGNPAAAIYSTNEVQRQALIARQLDLNRQMIWSSGYAGPLDPWWSVPSINWRYPRPLVEQPIGHESIQTGPNRWIYRPLYARDVQPPETIWAPPADLGAVQQAPVQLPGPSNPEPLVRPLPGPQPKKPPLPGPREF